MKTKEKREKYTKMGNGWCEHDIVSVEGGERQGEFFIGVTIGEQYYETDLYSRKDYALCEAKGYLEGVRTQIDGVLDNINKDIENIPL